MKVEVINRSTHKTIGTYSVPEFSMFDFQEWMEPSEVVIDLERLSDTVANLDSKDPEDPETQKPISNPTGVDFYLPDPLKNRVYSQLAKSKTNTEEYPGQFADRRKEITEKVSTPELESRTILSAVVTEVLQNHHPHSDYKVRISDG